MFLATINGTTERAEARPGARGTCPACLGPVLAKCGHVKAWHWSHAPGSNCIMARRPMTQWHLDWQRCFPLAWREIRHQDADGGLHIADVLTPSGLALEFQASSITEAERASRERAYRAMIWIVKRPAMTPEAQYMLAAARTRYLEPRPALATPRQWAGRPVPVVLDHGGPLLCLMPHPGPSGPWCYFLTQTDLIGAACDENSPLQRAWIADIEHARQRRQQAAKRAAAASPAQIGNTPWTDWLSQLHRPHRR